VNRDYWTRLVDALSLDLARLLEIWEAETNQEEKQRLREVIELLDEEIEHAKGQM
jgi:hypothetical protein